MKKLAAFLLLALCAPLALATEARIGAPAPDFALADLDGEVRTLAEFAGKTVVLEWTNHECPFVVKHYRGGNMQRQQAAATGDGVVWLLINSSAPGLQGHVTAAQARAIKEEWEAQQTHYLFDTDGTVGRAYGARTTPHMYIIDAEGILRYNGAIDSVPSANPADIEGADQFVELALAELAAGESVSRPVTQPYGCSVKYAGS